jgi:hypothetical protein
MFIVPVLGFTINALIAFCFWPATVEFLKLLLGKGSTILENLHTASDRKILGDKIAQSDRC